MKTLTTCDLWSWIPHAMPRSGFACDLGSRPLQKSKNPTSAWWSEFQHEIGVQIAQEDLGWRRGSAGCTEEHRFKITDPS